jgi:hypothetical protein
LSEARAQRYLLRDNEINSDEDRFLCRVIRGADGLCTVERGLAVKENS